MDCYRSFCKLYGFKPFPCSPDRACLYATFLSAFMVSSSVSNYLSALWSHQRGLGMESFPSDYRLQQTLKGIRRLGRPGRRPRHPFSVEDLRAIYLSLNTLLPKDLVFWCAITLSYRALLRKSHYTPSPHTLRWRDNSIYPDHLVLVLPSSKTDQFSVRPHRIVLNASPGSNLCPVRWLTELSKAHKPLENDFIFCLPITGGFAQMDYAWFNARLKDVSLRVGLSPVAVSSHSLRHGGASLMASLGSTMMDIRARGGWSSSAMFRYLHHSVETLRRLDKDVADNIFLYSLNMWFGGLWPLFGLTPLFRQPHLPRYITIP